MARMPMVRPSPALLVAGPALTFLLSQTRLARVKLARPTRLLAPPLELLPGKLDASSPQ